MPDSASRPSEITNSRDALLGQANAQLKLGRIAEARSTYARLLTLNPQDALARVGLMQTISTADPAAYENELLKLRNQFPEVAQLSFVLRAFPKAHRRAACVIAWSIQISHWAEDLSR